MHTGPQLTEIFEMNLRELSLGLGGLSRASKEWFYGHGLELFLTNQLEKLAGHVEQASEEFAELATLLKLRLEIRSGQILPATKQSCIAIADQRSELSGEALFVLAMAEECAHNEVAAAAYWTLAEAELEKHGARRKALKAAHNYLATQTRIDPTKPSIPGYRALILKCEALNENVVLANAELNISREFQIIGAVNVALRHANRAVDLTKEFQPGGLQYFLSIAQRCHLLIELERRSLALIDFEELQTSVFPEIIAIAKVLELQFQKSLYVDIHTEGASDITFSWERRQKAFETQLPAGAKYAYTELEQKVIDALTEGPKTRFELIERLFGHSGDIFALENRLKQILFRIRKKAPGLIDLQDQKYMFSEKDLPLTGSK